ncbi:MAG: DUF4423 domain-containing protein, partial [Deltaproteobacteria bacterium]|nr:DUF4423 domain-containing protein [Deltaproteobacteria bacterium]
RDDPSWISKKLRYKISPAEAKRAIQLLLELGLLTREKGNKFKLTDSTLTTPAEVADVCMTQFHQEMLNQAKESLLRDSGWHREVSVLTAALTLTQFKQIKQEIQEFQTKIMQRFEKPDTEATTVCQFNCQLFTLTDLNGVPHE